MGNGRQLWRDIVYLYGSNTDKDADALKKRLYCCDQVAISCFK